MVKNIFCLILVIFFSTGCRIRVVHSQHHHVHVRIANENRCACGYHLHSGRWVKAPRKIHHVHARIGHEEGPQVPEPRAPEWKKATDAHFEWWDKVVALKKDANVPLTVTTEFGPANYMWTTPYTRQPVADQWEINVFMMNEWRKRYL